MIALDTNLLVYVHDQKDPTKQAQARSVMETLAERSDVAVALQVLGELYAVLTRKLGQPPQLARQATLSVATAFQTYGYTLMDVERALLLAENGVSSYWDGLLLSASEQAGCRLLLTEDLQNGFHFGSLEVLSPFSEAGVSPELIRRLE